MIFYNGIALYKLYKILVILHLIWIKIFIVQINNLI
jgi:hypothetical protein